MSPEPQLPAFNQVLTYRANGKLLITGEYAVLDGATALALPTKLGQNLNVEMGENPGFLHWKSLDHEGKVWFQAVFSLPELTVKDPSSMELASRLRNILALSGVANLDPNLSPDLITRIEFPRHWGLGSSSTLLSLIAQWTGTDPYKLAEESFGGSGYDIACAAANGPILYQRKDEGRDAVEIPFRPSFSDRLYFVGLNAKKDTREGIARYRDRSGSDPGAIENLSALTLKCLAAKTLADFDMVIREHENLVSDLVGLPKAKDLLFSDYWGEVKSLGAWGGDFVMASSERSEKETRGYFAQRGYNTFFPYRELILGA